MLKLFVGQYKDKRALIKFNMVRYTTIGMILNYNFYMYAFSVNPIGSMTSLKSR